MPADASTVALGSRAVGWPRLHPTTAAHLQRHLGRPVPRKAGVKHAVVKEDGVQVALCMRGRVSGRGAVDGKPQPLSAGSGARRCFSAWVRLVEGQALAWQVCRTLASE